MTEPKASEAGVTAASGPGRTPVPLSVTSEGDAAALCAMLSVADAGPAAVGANATLMVQVPPATTVVQVLPVMENSVGSVPPSVAPVTVRSAWPVLVTVTSWLADVAPVVTDPKSSDVGATTATGGSTGTVAIATVETDVTVMPGKAPP